MLHIKLESLYKQIGFFDCSMCTLLLSFKRMLGKVIILSHADTGRKEMVIKIKCGIFLMYYNINKSCTVHAKYTRTCTLNSFLYPCEFHNQLRGVPVGKVTYVYLVCITNNLVPIIYLLIFYVIRNVVYKPYGRTIRGICYITEHLHTWGRGML